MGGGKEKIKKKKREKGGAAKGKRKGKIEVLFRLVYQHIGAMFPRKGAMTARESIVEKEKKKEGDRRGGGGGTRARSFSVVLARPRGKEDTRKEKEEGKKKEKEGGKEGGKGEATKGQHPVARHDGGDAG